MVQYKLKRKKGGEIGNLGRLGNKFLWAKQYGILDDQTAKF